MGLVRGDTREIFSGLVDMAKGAYRTKEADELSRKTNTAPGDVIALSGCKDSQTVSRVGSPRRSRSRGLSGLERV